MTTVKDPVCGMNIDRDSAAATTLYDGTMYYFCSTACKKAFDAMPARYAYQHSRQYEPPSTQAGGSTAGNARDRMPTGKGRAS